MKQKTIDHEMMSAGDPHHDHATCGGTTSLVEAQKQTNLLAEILTIGNIVGSYHFSLIFTKYIYPITFTLKSSKN